MTCANERAKAYQDKKAAQHAESGQCRSCGRPREPGSNKCAYHKRQQRHDNLKAQYGVTLEQYQEMLRRQGGVCEICGCPETRKAKGGKSLHPLGVDHNHKTGQVRALLCQRCNLMIGQLENSETLFWKGAEYLKKYASLAGGA